MPEGVGNEAPVAEVIVISSSPSDLGSIDDDTHPSASQADGDVPNSLSHVLETTSSTSLLSCVSGGGEPLGETSARTESPPVVFRDDYEDVEHFGGERLSFMRCTQGGVGHFPHRL